MRCLIRKALVTVVINFVFINCFSQVKTIVTDSCYISSHKFILTDTDGIAEIKAFLKGEEIPVLKTIKMSAPVYFVKENGKENVLQDDIFIENGDIVKTFLIVGNEAPMCMRKDRNLKFKDGFCGMNVQGVLISPDGITLTDFMYNDFSCVKENYLELKDLYSFANSDIK